MSTDTLRVALSLCGFIGVILLVIRVLFNLREITPFLHMIPTIMMAILLGWLLITLSTPRDNPGRTSAPTCACERDE
jgi:hypothetical protein